MAEIGGIVTKLTARRLYLLGGVDEKTTGECIRKIIAWNDEDAESEKKVKDFVREPIYLTVMSGGGYVYDGLGLVDTIHWSKTPVYTVAIGGVMSMGLWIFLAGEKRLVGKKAFLMWHDVASISHGKTQDIEENLEQMKIIQNESISYVLERTKVKKEVIAAKITSKKDWYINAAEAKKYGFATEYWYK